MHERKVGRPALPDEDRKRCSVRIRLSNAELLDVKKKAEAEEVSVSSYIRERIKTNGRIEIGGI